MGVTRAWRPTGASVDYVSFEPDLDKMRALGGGGFSEWLKTRDEGGGGFLVW